MSGQAAPPRVPPRVKAAPKIRSLYWCDFPKDAQLPELWKERPVVVISYRNDLRGAVTVIPTTTDPGAGDPWLVPLSASFDGRRSFAICDKPCTVAVSRLRLHGRKTFRIPEGDFDAILRKLYDWLPAPKP